MRSADLDVRGQSAKFDLWLRADRLKTHTLGLIAGQCALAMKDWSKKRYFRIWHSTDT
jgi:hypothetical protein